MPTKVKKSFKKYASKHLSTVIETRRKTRDARKEKEQRLETRKIREEKERKREEDEHAADLAKLHDTDPELFSYLEKEDPGLLHFGEEMDDDQLEGSDAETEEGEAEARGGGDEEAGAQEQPQVKEPNAQQGGPKECVDVFISGLRALGYKVKEEPTAATTRKFAKLNAVKTETVKAARRLATEATATKTSGAKQHKLISSSTGSFVNDSAKYTTKRFLQVCIGFLNQECTDPHLVVEVLHAIGAFVNVFHHIKGMTKASLKGALSLCGHEDETLRVAAYTVVRAIATRGAGTRSMYQSAAFKGIFLALVRSTHQFTIRQIPIVNSLMNAVVDLYGTDIEAGYQHAFVYIRQLAVYLRAALQQQSSTNIRAVFNWQFLHALRTWAIVVAAYPEPNQLGPLIHPVVQIAVGLLELFNSPRMFPLHLSVLEVLNKLASSTGCYIPLAPYILRIMTSPAMELDSSATKKAARAEQQQQQQQGGQQQQRHNTSSSPPQSAASDVTDAFDLQFLLRIKKNQMKDVKLLTCIWSECLYFLVEHLASASFAVGFPEAFWTVLSTLTKLRKEVKIPRIHSMINITIAQIEETCKKICTRRDDGGFGPCDIDAVQAFEQSLKSEGTPLSKYFETFRAKRRQEFTMRLKSYFDERETLEGTAAAHEGGDRDGKRRRKN